MSRRRRKPKARPLCRDLRVWGYPATEDVEGEIHWAWSCRCGRYGDSFPDEESARRDAEDHGLSFQEALDRV